MTETAKERILGKVRSSLGVSADDPVRLRTARERISAHKRNLVPARAKGGADSNVDLFTRMLEGQGATVSHVDSNKDIPELVAGYLRENNLPAEFRTGNDALIDDIPWSNAPALTRHLGKAVGSDAVTISRASTAAAETGTLFLASGEDNPTTLNFLPDTHIAIIRKKDILGSYEDAWDALRSVYGEQSMPRTVNLVSGPSRTADIEQIIVMGAHGPRRLHVIVTD